VVLVCVCVCVHAYASYSLVLCRVTWLAYSFLFTIESAQIWYRGKSIAQSTVAVKLLSHRSSFRYGHIAFVNPHCFNYRFFFRFFVVQSSYSFALRRLRSSFQKYACVLQIVLSLCMRRIVGFTYFVFLCSPWAFTVIICTLQGVARAVVHLSQRVEAMVYQSPAALSYGRLSSAGGGGSRRVEKWEPTLEQGHNLQLAALLARLHEHLGK
jgi:hypothetical protein